MTKGKKGKNKGSYEGMEREVTEATKIISKTFNLRGLCINCNNPVEVKGQHLGVSSLMPCGRI